MYTWSRTTQISHIIIYIMQYILYRIPNLSTGSWLGFLAAYPLQHSVRDLSIMYIYVYRIVKIPWTQRLPFVSSACPWVDRDVTDALSSSDLDGGVSTTRSWANPFWPWLRATLAGSFCTAKSAIKILIPIHEKDGQRGGLGKRFERYDNVLIA